MGKKIQYRGTSDVVRILAGEDWGGRLADPISQKVEWNRKNNHLVSTDDVGLSDAAVELLLEDTDRFLDVTDREVIPINGWQKMWGGMADAATQVVGVAPVEEVEETPPPVDPPVDTPVEPPEAKATNKGK